MPRCSAPRAEVRAASKPEALFTEESHTDIITAPVFSDLMGIASCLLPGEPQPVSPSLALG